MFVSDVSDFYFVRKVKPYFLSAGEEVLKSSRNGFLNNEFKVNYRKLMIKKIIFKNA